MDYFIPVAPGWVLSQSGRDRYPGNSLIGWWSEDQGPDSYGPALYPVIWEDGFTVLQHDQVRDIWQSSIAVEQV